MITDPTFSRMIANTVNTTNGRVRLGISPFFWKSFRCFLSKDNPVATATGTATQQMHIIYLLLVWSTGIAQSKDLQPMALNLKSGSFRDSNK